MEVYELNSRTYANRFYVKSCAEVFQRIYGGTIKELHEQEQQKAAVPQNKPPQQ